jgi:hypothetical protein
MRAARGDEDAAEFLDVIALAALNADLNGEALRPSMVVLTFLPPMEIPRHRARPWR